MFFFLLNFVCLAHFFLNRNTYITTRRDLEPYKKGMAPILQNIPLFDALDISILPGEAPI